VTTLDSQRGDVAVVVAAGGAGTRLGGGVPKALRRLAGEPLLLHTLRRVVAAGSVGWVVVAAPPDHQVAVHRVLSSAGELSGWRERIAVVPGGEHRQQSVAAALAAVPAGFGIVLVHDAARALTPTAQLEAVAAAVRSGRDAVIPVLPVADTISQLGPAGEVTGQPDRSTLRAVQTPQGFRRAVLAAAHATPAPAGAPITDDAGLVARLGVPVHTIPGSAYALKITTRFDLLVAGALLAGAGSDPP
jgi:2-C-methyl-D-erythritol 4-phosphate cytidylyltransferase